MKALTQTEFRKMVEVAPTLRDRCILLMGFQHGMRVSEICQLRRADIDMAARTIIVRRLKHSLTTTQPLGAEEHEALSKWLSAAPNSVWCFPGRGKSHLTRRAVEYMFERVGEIAQIPQAKRHPHTLRHGLAYSMIQANVSLPIIQRALGHAAISSTAVYAIPSEETVGAALLSVFPKKEGR